MGLEEISRYIHGNTGLEHEKLYSHKHKNESTYQNPIVTVSRDPGSNYEIITQKLAQELGVNCYDRAILDAIVTDSKMHRSFMERFDERCAGLMDDLANSIMFGQFSLNDDYFCSLKQVVKVIAMKGGIIVGRGAHLILTDPEVLRIRITGSQDVCVNRLMENLSISKEEALKTYTRIKSDQAMFLKKQFNNDIDDPSNYDLTLNTDHINIETAVKTAMFFANNKKSTSHYAA